jgi:hypothetical protein
MIIQSFVLVDNRAEEVVLDPRRFRVTTNGRPETTQIGAKLQREEKIEDFAFFLL